MLAVLSALAALTFLPADPPLADVGCLSAAGDVVAGWQPPDAVVVSVADGPWERVAGLGDDCPRVAAAADGTAAIATEGKVAVRRAGGSFAAPIGTGRTVMPPEVAVAPGGWVAVLRQTRTGPMLRPRYALILTTVAPDGSIAHRTLDRARESFQHPRVGIDGGGTASAVWTRPKGDWYGVRTWPAGRSASLDFDPRYAAHVDVASSPGGRTLAAWADDGGIAISADGGPPLLVAADRWAGTPSVAVGDDGTAVLAYSVPVTGVVVTTRTPEGTWSAPRQVHGVRGSGLFEEPSQGFLDSALTPEGKPVVAWLGRQLYAAAGPDWRATPLSAITRYAAEFALAGGRVIWVERTAELPRPTDRLRGARVVEGEPTDTVAPVLTTRLPRRTPRTRDGQVTFAIPVRCSEACDARVRLLIRGGLEVAGTVRALEAGEDATLRLRTGWYAREIVKSRRVRRPRIEVVVTDRANNVARERRRVTYRVIARPILSYLVGPKRDFAMFSKAGNRAVARLVNELIRAAARREGGLRRAYRRGMHAIERRHLEVYDTAVTEEIFGALDVPLALAGYDAEAVMG